MIASNRIDAVPGQERVMETINRMLAKHEMPHALLFIGPEGTGKHETALAVASQLLKSERSTHPDLFVMEKPDSSIKIAEVRRLKEWLTLKPYMADCRVAVIAEAHMMTLEAANALLKLLEEPSPNIFLILTASQETLPATVVSRCQILKFRSLLPDEVEEILLAQGVPLELAGYLSIISDGSPGKALTMSGIQFDSTIALAAELVENLLSKNVLTALETAEALEKEPVQRYALFLVLEVFFRDALLCKKGLNHKMLLLPEGLATKLSAVGVGELASLLRSVGSTRRELSRNANPLLGQVNLYMKMAAVLKEVG